MSLVLIDQEVARMSVALPEMVVPQHMAALARACQVKSRRSETRAWLRAPYDHAESQRRCAEVLLDPPDHVESMSVFDLLRAVRGVGPARARQLCELAGARENREVGALSLRQRVLIAAELSGLRNRDLEELVA